MRMLALWTDFSRTAAPGQRRPAAVLPAGGALLAAALAWTAAAEPARPRASASSELPPKFAASKAVDGDTTTHWAAHNSLPQWIRVDLPQPARVDTLLVLGVSMQKLYDNWRRVSVSFSDGSAFAATFADTWGWTEVRLPARRVSWVKLTIESTYKRTYYVGCEEIRLRFAGRGAAAVQVTPRPARPRTRAAPAEPEQTDSRPRSPLLARLARPGQSPAPHCNLWVSAQDIERAKRRIRSKPWAFDYFQRTLRLADQWAAKSDADIRKLVPRPHAAFNRTAACPLCGKRLSADFSHPFTAWCRGCKQRFPNPRYPDDGRGWKNPKTGRRHYFVGCYNEFAIFQFDRALRALADAYALTGEEKFARALTVLFDALAAIYPTCTTGPKWYPGVGGRLNRPFYQTARTLIYYADEYDLTYSSPEWDKPSVAPRSKTRRENFERNLLHNGGRYCYDEIHRYATKSLNNGFCDYLQGALAAGRVLGVQPFIDAALKGELSIFNFIDNTIDRDGQYFETAFMYSSHALNLFSHHAEMLRGYRSPKYPRGVNLYDLPKLQLAFRRSERDVDCAGHTPPLGDTGPDLSVLRGSQRPRFNRNAYRRLEFLAARVSDPAARRRYAEELAAYVGDLDQARRRVGSARWLTFHAAAPPSRPPAGPRPAPDSTLLPAGRGIAILRSGEEAAALLRWGPTLNHGSPDELNLNFFALGRELTYDPGYGWAHYRAGWAHATGSHNLVVVDEANQLGREGSGGELETWLLAPGVRAVSANDPLCYAAQNVSRYQRTLVLLDYGADRSGLLDVFRVKGGRTHDLNWHFVGALRPADGLSLSKAQTRGSLAGPRYEWWRQLQSDGWLRGLRRKGFYWAAPPGNGYGFLHEVRRGRPTGPCAFDWKAGERAPEPRWTFQPAAQVIRSSGRLHKPLALGCYFYRGRQPGDFIEFELPVEKAGRYMVLAVFYKSSHYGIVQASLDGEPLGRPVNTYSPVGYFTDTLALGERGLAAGAHRLRFSVVGKDPESLGFFFSLKYFALETPEDFARVSRREPEGVRLTICPPAGAEMLTARGVSVSRWPSAQYVICRRRSDRAALSSQFVSFAEPYVGEPIVSSVRRLAPDRDAAEALAAVRIAARGGRVDYVFEAVRPAPARAYAFGSERVRFAGRFGVARLVNGRARLLALYGDGEIAAGGRTLRVVRGERRGRVAAVDMARCAALTDTALPADGSLDGCIVQFSNPAYSRRSAFVVRRVARVGAGSRIELKAASLVMARGLVGRAASAANVIGNITPLDRERMVFRGRRTLYFQGRRILGPGGEDWGRVVDVNLLNWHVTSSRAVHAKVGERFQIAEIAPGDTFRIVRATWRRWGPGK